MDQSIIALHSYDDDDVFVCASVGGFGQIMFQVYLNYELHASIATSKA